jgi:hypothetical protein
MLDIYKTRRKREPMQRPEGIGGPEICDERTAEGFREYNRRRYQMEVRQGFQCAICERIAGSRMDFDHEQSRGGGKRDDRIEVDGKWKNAALCRKCNTLKGSKRYHWLNGKYVPVNNSQEAA